MTYNIANVLELLPLRRCKGVRSCIGKYWRLDHLRLTQKCLIMIKFIFNTFPDFCHKILVRNPKRLNFYPLLNAFTTDSNNFCLQRTNSSCIWSLRNLFYKDCLVSNKITLSNTANRINLIFPNFCYLKFSFHNKIHYFMIQIHLHLHILFILQRRKHWFSFFKKYMFVKKSILLTQLKQSTNLFQGKRLKNWSLVQHLLYLFIFLA